ncbi:MAG: hypothetical protein HY299_08970 [Verrucomicrobia bacterium]|nr:hypothetical protein [Verrucomicrobiota bacterium]
MRMRVNIVSSHRALLCLAAALSLFWTCPSAIAGSKHPYYQRPLPTETYADWAGDTAHIDFTTAHMPAFGPSTSVSEAGRLFTARAAAAISDATGIGSVTLGPSGFPNNDLLEQKSYSGFESIFIPTAKCLAAMAYPDFFHGARQDVRPLVSAAILASQPGWCGTFGPDIRQATDLGKTSEGNYDISQMHLLQIAYGYYDELSQEAQDHLVLDLLGGGHIHRVYLGNIYTSGGPPNDWARAGRYDPLGGGRIGETENHILMIHTARYLSNQLLYQRDHDPSHDNRRNGPSDGPSCTDLMLALLRNILRDDFSEYNAKPYQEETRSALLNLYSYAYDDEVRLAARMVLDYVSAHIAVSSSDLRRMVPFRRRNESGGGDHHHRSDQMADHPGFMDVGLINWDLGADPMVERFAIQAGNLRALETGAPDRPWAWGIGSDGTGAAMEALSDYRLPPSIHDLFVNDLHRRFFQRLRRTPRSDEVEGSRNCDNVEIYAGSPSYLISAGGRPATFAIDPGPAALLAPSSQEQQLGVAVTTSFMPTISSQEWLSGGGGQARNLIQFSHFSAHPDEVENYGVAPDFAFGIQMYLPPWVPTPNDREFLFIDRSYPGRGDLPGYYLAIFKDGDLGCLEAFDVWLHPGLSFSDFKRGVLNRNPGFRLRTNVEMVYTTQNGNRVRFIIQNGLGGTAAHSDRVLGIDYGASDPADNMGDAGNITDRFLNGTILNSPADAVVEITNPVPYPGTKITLDMANQWHPKRISETGEVEEAGNGHEVWVDFDWTGPQEGDFFRPFNTISAAVAAVANGGVIKIMPGFTSEKPSFPRNKRIRFVAPIGGVRIGAQ